MKEEFMTDKNINVKKEIAKIRIKRIGMKIKLFFQSEILENYFHEISNGKTKKQFGQELYIIPEESKISRKYREYLCFQNDLYFDLGGMIFGFIRAVGVKDGIEIDMVGDYSAEELARWLEEVSVKIKEFYGNYVKNFVNEIVIC